MKAFIRILIPAVLALFTTASIGAETVHLYLKGTKGKTYKVVKTDPQGKFSFDDLEPDTYTLIWILPDGTTPENTESASIEIESFSWGVSQMNHHGSSTSSNQRTSEPAQQAATPVGSGSDRPTGGPSGGAPTGQPTPPPGMGGGGGGGSAERSGKITKSRSNIQNNRMASEFKSMPGGKYYVVLMEDIVISSASSSCEGTCGRMAINEKGLPGEKGTKKGNK